MKNFARQATLLVVLASVLGVAFGVPPTCTPQTCPPGPVEARFDSVDCTGTPSFVPFGASEIGTCQVLSSTGSMRYDETPEYLLYIEVNNPSCDLTPGNATFYIQQDWYGVCRPRNNQGRELTAATSSYMVLSNVNATYSAPQSLTVNLNYPNSYQVTTTEQCITATNCTRSDGVVAEYYSSNHDLNCNPTHSVGIFNRSYDGTCYRDGDLRYSSTNCIDHGTLTRYYVGDGCQHVYSVEINRAVCAPGDAYSYTCTTTPVPLPNFGAPSASPVSGSPTAPGSPSSSAASFLPSFFIIGAALSALLV